MFKIFFSDDNTPARSVCIIKISFYIQNKSHSLLEFPHKICELPCYQDRRSENVTCTSTKYYCNGIIILVRTVVVKLT